jgi:hypothetical protein
MTRVGGLPGSLMNEPDVRDIAKWNVHKSVFLGEDFLILNKSPSLNACLQTWAKTKITRTLIYDIHRTIYLSQRKPKHHQTPNEDIDQP